MQTHMPRRIVMLAVVLLATILLVSSQLHAQEGGSARRLVPNEPVAGTLNAEIFAESYIFDASTGNTISITASTSSQNLSLALILTDPNGNIVAQDGDLSSPQTASLDDLTLNDNGTYVVTVMRGSGADGDSSGIYTLVLSGELTTPDSSDTPSTTSGLPESIQRGESVYILTDNGGIEIELQWSTGVDLNLEVRDPVGGTLYFDSLAVASGGIHDGNVNGLCDDVITDNPTERVSWPTGYVPVGSYEIIIYYEQICDLGGPQTFTLTSSVNGEAPEVINGVINPGQDYLARLTVNVNKSWSLFNGGVNAGLDLAPVTPEEIIPGQTLTGNITNAKPKDGYTFDVAAGDTINVEMTATSGSLDTLLILLGPDGRAVADNDDRASGVTDSQIQVSAPSTGTYTVLATRYGQVIGGTEGDYSLFINLGGSVVDTGPGTTPATQTPPTTVGPPAGSIEVLLQWATNADLQLQVRDPQGNTVYDDVPTIPSGGILDQNYVGNRGCVTAAGTPTYFIYWPTTRIPPVGTYEVEIWYQNDCGDPTPVDFDLSIKVNGQLLSQPDTNTTVTSTATTPGNRYLITFTIDQAGAVSAGEGGFFNMNSLDSGLDYRDELATGQLIPYDTLVQGRIDQEQKFVVYRFEGIQGDRIGVEMNRTSGSLDPALYILDPTQVQLAFNDDIEAGVDPDSRIAELQLPQTGTYYIIATHYGLRYGGTQGDFTLRLNVFP